MLDIKLKKNNKITILIITLVVLIPAIASVAMYPVFHKGAERSVNTSVQNHLDDDLLYSLTQGSFILFQEAMETQDNQKYSFSDLFLSSDYVGNQSSNSEDYAYSNLPSREDLAMDINWELYSWKQHFEDIRINLDYAVYNSDNELIVTNAADDSLDSLLKNSEFSGKAMESYSAVLVMQYNSVGSLTANLYTEMESEDAINTLERFNRDNVLLYIPNTMSVPEAINQPSDISIVYLIPDDSILLTANEYWEHWDYYLAYNDAGFFNWYGWMLAIIAIAAVVLPFIKKLEIGKQKIFRLPLEIAFILMICICQWHYSLMELAASTNQGEFLQSAAYLIPSDTLRSIIGVPVNVAIWAFIFALWYIVITSLRAVISMGVKNYLRERSLIWRFGLWLKGYYMNLANTNLDEQTNKHFRKFITINFIIVAGICIMWVFGIGAAIIYSFVLYSLLKKYIGDIKSKYEKLLRATNDMAEGNLDIIIEEDLGIFNSYKKSLQMIQTGFKKAVDKEVASQHMRTELITNVSHDLKTPLTAIITYVNLLKDENITEEERKSYIETIDSKSMRLRALIEDLFEVSKADSKNVTLNIISVDLIDLIKQVYYELNNTISEADLEFRMNLPEKKVMLALDSQKTYRIFENLFTNCIKYALKGTRVYIDIVENDNEVAVMFKNISTAELNFPPEKLTERFIRGDIARNTEGSGLGLAIARSFIELQGGKLDIEIDGDLFKATARFYKR